MPGPGAPVEARDHAESDWTYVKIRRLLIYIERSIDEDAQWAAFEPNGVALWARVGGVAEGVLSGLWRKGALMGKRAEEAFFVRCDSTTMTQADIDGGRLIMEIGFAAVRPAQFVIFRMLRPTAPPS